MLKVLRRFLRHTRGNVAPIFAIAAIPLITATGAAVDYSQAYQERWVVQDALDAAALAAGKMMGSATDEEIEEVAANFYQANIGDKITDPPAFETTIEDGTLTLETNLEVPTNFLGIVGVDDIVFSLKSQVMLGSGRLEVALVLDNSGSMSGTKISTLRTAASDLVEKLFDLGEVSTKPDPIRVALVPFSGAVNVGSSYKTASWMDTGGIATYMGETFEETSSSTPVNVFNLFTAMNGQSWGGCVEERPIPHDVDDATPTTSDKTTLFVPMFAPDEPDNWTCTTSNCTYTGSGSSRAYSGAPSGTQGFNNYIADTTGSCTGIDAAKVNSSNEQAAMRRTCKYTGKTPVSINLGGIAGGPNFYCNNTAITPLTTNESTAQSAISVMAATGATNIMSGLGWGLRVLSPTEPFTQGRAYGEDDNTKVVVLMTDGANTYYPNSKFVKSWYGAYGYIWKGHLGTTSTSISTIVTKQNQRTAVACDNIKAAGIQIYTLAFNITDSTTLQMLEDCATEVDMAFDASSNSELLAAFEAIGQDISQLRIAQ